MQDKCQKVKTKPVEICKSVRKVNQFCLRLSQCLVAVKNKVAHIVGRHIAVVEKMLLSGFCSVKVLFKAWKFFFIFNEELNERSNIFDIVHDLSVHPLPHHQELSACNLTQKVADISIL